MDNKDKFIFHSSEMPIKSFLFFEAKRKEFCDITLKVGEQYIVAHRMILAAAIPYFYDIFCEKKGLNSQKMEIKFPDVHPCALKSLIDFAYSCQIEINDDNVMHLLPAACLLRVDLVKNECLSFLVKRLKPGNAVSTQEVLCKLCSSEELEKVNSYIRDNFEEVSRTSDILNVPFEALKDFTGNDNLKVESEECVYETIVKWVKQFPEERKHYLPRLLNNVRMTFIKPLYIRNRILKEELIRTSIECRDLLDEAVFYHTTPEATVEACHFITRPRNVAANTHKDEDISSIYAMNIKIDSTIQSLNADATEWKTTYKIPNHYKITACVLNKTVYLFHPKFTYKYDLQQNVLSFSKGMTLPRIMAASVPHNNKLYVLGGYVCDLERRIPTNSVQCFDPETGEWIALTGMNICRGCLGTVASPEFIYGLGGLNSNEGVLNSVERYNVKTGLWTMMRPMLSERLFLGCVMLKDKIYVCGGMTMDLVPLSTAEVFDLVTNDWNFISSMQKDAFMCKLVPFCGKLYSIGVDEDSSHPVVQIYEPETNKWKFGPTMKDCSFVVAAAVLNMPSE